MYSILGFGNNAYTHTNINVDPEDLLNAFFGRGAKGSSGMGGGGGGGGGGIFDNLFGRAERNSEFASGSSASQASLHIQQTVALSFMEAVRGCLKTITFSRVSTCESCSGSSVQPGKKLSKCKACDGKGRQILSRSGMIFELPCTVCNGLGKVNADPCQTCSGEGLTAKTVTLEVKIPQGVDEASQVMLKGAGHAHSGRHGHVSLRFKVMFCTSMGASY